MPRKKKKAKGTGLNEIIKDAASLWDFLREEAGLDSIFYDKEFLLGNSTSKGLYTQLKISARHKDFKEDLNSYNISVEKLVAAFFKTLQPYSQMMNDICVFFERHYIKETNKHINISFDFSQVGGEKLNFKLEHFKQVLARFTKVQSLIEYFTLDDNTIFKLNEVISGGEWPRENHPGAERWIGNYRSGRQMTGEEINLPATPSEKLNEQLQRAFRIWKSFLRACAAIGLTYQNYRDLMFKKREPGDMDKTPNVYGWEERLLAMATSNIWVISFLNCLLFRADRLGQLENGEAILQCEGLAGELQAFLDKVTVTKEETENILDELEDLLNLPIWQKRSELYAAWILALMDRVLAKYPNVVHHIDGTLNLAFKATHLVTIETKEGLVELWSEVRSPVSAPEGKSRKDNIQPDYCYYKPTSDDPANAIAAVEVKQYRKASPGNFRPALNDYGKGLPNAHIFLANYGPVPVEMKLAYPGRAEPIGQILPGSANIKKFLEALGDKLPGPFVKLKFGAFTDEECLQLTTGFDVVYVDISGSQDTPSYKEYISNFLAWLLEHGRIKRLVAVDEYVRQEWPGPTSESVKELVSLAFNNSTDFARFLDVDAQMLVITDDDGLNKMRGFGIKNASILRYEEGNEPVLITH